MKIFKDKKVEYTTKELIEVKCDLCGKVAKGDDWEASAWEVNETEVSIAVKQKDGTNYPEGGDGTIYQADICPDCFKGKLIPWLESQGCTAKRRDWDW